MKWVQQPLSKASQILESCISEDSGANGRSSLFTPPISGTKKSKKSKAMSSSLSRAVTAVYTVGSLVVICPSADMSTIIPLLHTVIMSGNSDPKLKKLPGPKASFKETAPLLYVQAWLTLGKICLADEKLAKRYIPLFVQVCYHPSIMCTFFFYQHTDTYRCKYFHLHKDTFNACISAHRY